MKKIKPKRSRANNARDGQIDKVSQHKNRKKNSNRNVIAQKSKSVRLTFLLCNSIQPSRIKPLFAFAAPRFRGAFREKAVVAVCDSSLVAFCVADTGCNGA